MDFVLDKVVYQRHECAEEQTGECLSIIYGLGVDRRGGETPERPRQSEYEVRDHENIVPIMIIGGCDVDPTSTEEGSCDTDERNELGQSGTGSRSQEIP